MKVSDSHFFFFFFWLPDLTSTVYKYVLYINKCLCGCLSMCVCPCNNNCVLEMDYRAQWQRKWKPVFVFVFMWFRRHAGQIHHSHGRIVVCFLFGSDGQRSFHQSCLKNTCFRLKCKISKPCVCERDLKLPYMLT